MISKSALTFSSASLLLLAPVFANAQLISSTSFSITELRISSDVDATIQWLDEWEGEVETEAFDSASFDASNSDDGSSFNLSLEAPANTLLTQANSTIDLSGGETLGFGSGALNIGAFADMDLNLSDVTAQAVSMASLFNAFTLFDIAGGSLANLTIELDFEYGLDSVLSNGADFDSMLGAGLFVFDSNDQSGDVDTVDGMLMDMEMLFHQGEQSVSGAGTLAVSALFQSEKEYELFAFSGLDQLGYSGEFDDEPPVEVSAPNSLLLGLLGSTMLLGVRRRRKH